MKNAITLALLLAEIKNDDQIFYQKLIIADSIRKLVVEKTEPKIKEAIKELLTIRNRSEYRKTILNIFLWYLEKEYQNVLYMLKVKKLQGEDEPDKKIESLSLALSGYTDFDLWDEIEKPMKKERLYWNRQVFEVVRNMRLPTMNRLHNYIDTIKKMIEFNNTKSTLSNSLLSRIKKCIDS